MRAFKNTDDHKSLFSVLKLKKLIRDYTIVDKKGELKIKVIANY